MSSTSSRNSRRQFLLSLSALATTALPTAALARALEPSLYPPADLSYFERPLTPAAAEIRFGYHAITWGGNDRQAINEISELGFPGIQLRSNILAEYASKPQALGDLLRERRLKFVALSGGGPRGSDYDEAEAVAAQVKHATFMRDAGGLYLQMTDSSRPKERQPAAEDFKKLGRVLTEVGKRSADLGIITAYHNHMNSLGEAPDEVDRVMDAADPRYVKLLLDVAHYTQGGGDPAKAVRQYRDRILFLHIKDVETLPAAADPARAYRFVELGRGRVNLPAVFAALDAINFRGWGIIELDSVPDKSRTPKECAIISRKYLQEKIKLRL